MTTNQIKFNPRSVIDGMRKWFSDQEDGKAYDDDTRLRLTRTFNLLREQGELAHDQVTCRAMLMWAAFNNLYSVPDKVELRKQSHIPELELAKEFVRKVIRHDHLVSEKPPQAGPRRDPDGKWCIMGISRCHDDMLTLAECRWAYPRMPEKHWVRTRDRAMTKIERRKGITNPLLETVVLAYAIRNLVVHGDVDPCAGFLTKELRAMCSFMHTILAMALQVTMERPGYFREQVRFGKADSYPYPLRLHS
jgi:hypothetical protein